MVNIKVKRLHPDAVIPTKAHPTDACFDLTATNMWYDDYGNLCFSFGLAFEIPEGYVMKIYPRSSISKYNLVLSNCVGIVDCDYRGEVSAKFKRAKGPKTTTMPDYKVGDRVAQAMIEKVLPVEFTEVDQLSETERGTNGYGSTGR